MKYALIVLMMFVVIGCGEPDKLRGGQITYGYIVADENLPEMRDWMKDALSGAEEPQHAVRSIHRKAKELYGVRVVGIAFPQTHTYERLFKPYDQLNDEYKRLCDQWKLTH